MNLFDARQQGKNDFVVSEPMELTDPPDWITDTMIKRFPELAFKKAELKKWQHQRDAVLIAMRDQIDAIARKLNAKI